MITKTCKYNRQGKRPIVVKDVVYGVVKAMDRLDLDGLIESKKTGEGPGSGGLPTEQTMEKRGPVGGARGGKGAPRLGVL